MEITTAMLADAAHVADGKLYVLGGAFDTINARTVPVVHGSLSVVLVAQVGQAERNRDLALVIRLVDEDEKAVGVEAQGQLRVGAPPGLRPGDASIVPMTITLHDVRLPEAKGYSFRVMHGAQELARIPFRVAVLPTSGA
jgi:hypothetical protein